MFYGKRLVYKKNQTKLTLEPSQKRQILAKK